MTARKFNASAFEFSKSKLKMCFVLCAEASCRVTHSGTAASVCARWLHCFQQNFNFRGITKLSGSRKRIGGLAILPPLSLPWNAP
jgi:hypothetical protein